MNPANPEAVISTTQKREWLNKLAQRLLSNAIEWSNLTDSQVYEIYAAFSAFPREPRPLKREKSGGLDAKRLDWLDKNYGREKQYWYGQRTIRDAIDLAIRNGTAQFGDGGKGKEPHADQA